MTIQQIEYFLSLAQRLNFTSVAERFFITQPTLSRQIIRLEEELNTQLFIRQNNKVTLTPAGALLYDELKSTYPKFLTLLRRVADVGQAHEKLTIGLLVGLQLNKYIIDAIDALRSTCYPDLQISIETHSLIELQKRIIDEEIDIANVIIPPYDSLSGLEKLPLDKQCYCLAIAKSYFALPPKEITMEQLGNILEQMPLMLAANSNFPSPWEDPMEHLSTSLHHTFPFQPKIRLVRGLGDIAPQVCAGLGVAVLNENHLIALDPYALLIPIKNNSHFVTGLIYSSKSMNAARDMFINLVSCRTAP